MNSPYDQFSPNQKPRVHIQYEVETNGSTEQKELPLVIGVLGDFTGDAPGKTLPKLADRDFIDITVDNFDAVMSDLKPGVQFLVDNALTDEASQLKVSLTFNALADFEPESLIAQVPALQRLKQTRDQLRDLLIEAERSDEFEKALEQILQDFPNITGLQAPDEAHTTTSSPTQTEKETS